MTRFSEGSDQVRPGRSDCHFELMKGKVVEVQHLDKDRYGRVVANGHVGCMYLNREHVTKGLAGRYVQYDKRGDFTEIEQAARAARKGLWGDVNPVPPWDWRKGEKERRAVKRVGAGGQR